MPALSRPLSACLRLCAILVVAQVATADETLVWKWSAGDTTRYELTQGMRMSMDAGQAGQIETSTSNVTTMRWTANAVNDGVATLSQETERVVMNTKGPMGQGFSYDSNSDEPPVGMAALIAPVFEAMCEHPFLVTMASSGKITEVVLSDELADAFDELPGGAISAEMIAQTSKQASLEFPDGPLVVGTQWDSVFTIATPQVGKMRVTVTYTYQGPRDVEGRELEAVGAEMSMQAVGQPAAAGASITIETKSSDGEFLFDRKAGRLFSSRLDQVFVVYVSVGEQEVTSEVEQNVAMRILAEGEQPTTGDDAPVQESAGSLAE